MHGEISATNEEIKMAAGDFEEKVSPYRSNTKRLEKIPGEYVLVPLTEGLSQGEELHFLLRIFSEMPIDLEEVFHDDILRYSSCVRYLIADCNYSCKLSFYFFN